jgi:hypothetical protein
MSEGTMRIPALWRGDALDPAFVDAWWAVVSESQETFSTFLPLWLVLQAGVPLSDVVPVAE